MEASRHGAQSLHFLFSASPSTVSAKLYLLFRVVSASSVVPGASTFYIYSPYVPILLGSGHGRGPTRVYHLAPCTYVCGCCGGCWKTRLSVSPVKKAGNGKMRWVSRTGTCPELLLDGIWPQEQMGIKTLGVK